MENNAQVIHLADYIQKRKAIHFEEGHSFSPVSLFKRVSAFFIDISCVFTIKAIFDVSYVLFVTNFLHLVQAERKIELLQTPLWLNIATFLVCYVGYFFLSSTLLEGQTIGQRVYGLVVCDKSGSPDGKISTAFKRTVGFTSYYLGLGLFQSFYFMNKDKRSFVDLISKTYLFNKKDLKQNKSEIIEIEIASLKTAA